MSLAGCDTPQGQNAAGGAFIGGASGALIGGAFDHPRRAAPWPAPPDRRRGGRDDRLGDPAGPGYAPPPRRCAEWYYDYYGNRVCRAYY